MIYFRRATFKDKKDILAFYRKAYPGDYTIRSSAQWDWQYEKNPFNKGELGIWLAIDDETNEVAGHTGVIFEEMLIGNTKYQVAWGIDLVILPEYRGQGLAKRLQHKMMQDVDFYMNISMSHTTRIVSAKLGAFETQEVVQFIKPLYVPPGRINHYLLLHTYAKDGFINKGLRLLLKKAGTGKWMVFMKYDKWLSARLNHRADRQNLSLNTGYDFREIKTMDELSLLEQVWNENKRNYDKIVIRDRKYLQWKYFDQPHKTHRLFVAVKEDHPEAYLVLREGSEGEPDVGIIVDYLCPKGNPALFEALLQLAVAYFVKKHKEFVYINSSETDHFNLLKKKGFKKSRTHHPSFLTDKPELKEYLRKDPEGWFLTFTDHELDRYPMRGK